MKDGLSFHKRAGKTVPMTCRRSLSAGAASINAHVLNCEECLDIFSEDGYFTLIWK